MEIPYVVTPRKDNGLFNSKIAIWLFLASEVMLFGGLFSGYLFLRLYADYPWPERALPVVPGLINTFVLIGSSVTVVFAWAALKMRKWGQFQFFMGITLLCSLLFMVLKGFEYKAKFDHQAARLKDFTVVEGHVLPAEIDDKGHLHPFHGSKEDKEKLKKEGKVFYANKVLFEAEEMTFTLNTYHDKYLANLQEQMDGKATASLAADLVVVEPVEGDDDKITPTEKVLFKAGTKLDEKVLAEAKEYFLNGRSANQKVRTKALKAAWSKVREEYPDLPNWKRAQYAKIDEAAVKPYLFQYASALTFKLDKPVTFKLKPRQIQEGETSSVLLDGTALKGHLHDSSMWLAVDSLDFMHLAMKAEEANKDPMEVIEKSWILENKDMRELWEKHKKATAILTKHLKEKDRVPTEADLYRVTWQKMAGYSQWDGGDISYDELFGKLIRGPFAGFTGADHKADHDRPESERWFKEVAIPRDKIALESTFTPRWNTYYAIYFTITGLHGLHVIGGALVLGYYMFFGKKMYKSNPEWLANRVEIGGLFWHFVDLVWIFLFPILYLM